MFYEMIMWLLWVEWGQVWRDLKWYLKSTKKIDTITLKPDMKIINLKNKILMPLILRTIKIFKHILHNYVFDITSIVKISIL